MIQVFFSYCNQDIKEYPGVLTLFKEELEKASDDNCSVLLDTEQLDLPGESIEEYESNAASSHAVIIFFGQEYVDRIEKKTNHHCVKEVNLVLERLKDKSSRMLLIPVLIYN